MTLCIHVHPKLTGIPSATTVITVDRMCQPGGAKVALLVLTRNRLTGFVSRTKRLWTTPRSVEIDEQIEIIYHSTGNNSHAGPRHKLHQIDDRVALCLRPFVMSNHGKKAGGSLNDHL
jgi:hypothetical protein